MNLQQLSVFLENRPGHLERLCRVLADADINIVTMNLADTSEFGIIRLIIREWREARTTLENAGFTTSATDVLAIEVAHKPGGLADTLRAAGAAGINVEYMYAFASGTPGKALVVIRPDGDTTHAAAALAAAGIGVLSAETFHAPEKTP
ncbi:MAG: amino acid-binding protein [Opitutaceae bacterium]|jgi:hypothetical protein|nr:amino acid-binding protein [Opitutaceae bacterium]